MVQERTRHTAPGLLMLLIFIIILVVAGLGIFRAARVGDVMTPDPRVVGEDELVADALERMETNEPGPITSLIIVTEDGRPHGVIHIHDCLRAVGHGCCRERVGGAQVAVDVDPEACVTDLERDARER